MDVMKLMVVILAGWINLQQEDVIDCATAPSGLVDCFATTTGMRRETDDSSFWTLRGVAFVAEYAMRPGPGGEDQGGEGRPRSSPPARRRPQGPGRWDQRETVRPRVPNL